MTPQQTMRRNRFIMNINMATGTQVMTDPFTPNDMHMDVAFVDSWQSEDWDDLPDEAKEQINTWVEQFRYNVMSLKEKRQPVQENISKLSLLILGDIKRTLTENGIK